MANVYIEPRPKGRPEGSHINDYVVEDHADHVLAAARTQDEAIDWAKREGHHPLVFGNWNDRAASYPRWVNTGREPMSRIGPRVTPQRRRGLQQIAPGRLPAHRAIRRWRVEPRCNRAARSSAADSPRRPNPCRRPPGRSKAHTPHPARPAMAMTDRPSTRSTSTVCCFVVFSLPVACAREAAEPRP